MTATKKTTTAKAATQEIPAAVLGGYEDFLAIGQGNVEALVESGSLFAKGVQEFNKIWFDLAQASALESANVAKTVLACKTLPEMLEVQGNLGKSNYEKMLADGQKLSGLSMKLAEEVSQPISARVNVAVEKLSKPLAA
ncbi:MAG: phasin family protein [Rhodospirillaceae bacterium]|nr:phasin family protein [Rhodospirillaceae bacterium]